MKRVAILGAGIGAEHLDAYLQLTDLFEVAYVCDLDLERAQSLARSSGAKAIDDMAVAFADPCIDLIDVSLPPKLHVPVSLQALEAGKDVIVEKPIAGCIAEADRLKQAAEGAGCQLFPVFQYRFGQALSSVFALKEAGFLQKPQVASLETHWSRDAAYYANPWRGTWDYELGGAVLSHAIHAHDLLCLLFGPVGSVSAALATRVNPIETEDCAAISFVMQNGALATSSITLGAADDTSRLRFVFDDVTIQSGLKPYAPASEPWQFQARDPSQQARLEEVIASAKPVQPGFTGFLASVSDALKGLPGRHPSLADGMASIELASAIYLSHRSGTRQTLPLDRGLKICQGLRPQQAEL